MFNPRIYPVFVSIILLSACSVPAEDSSDSSEIARTQASVDLEGEILLDRGSESIALTWITENVGNCTATGGWSGSKATSGQETIEVSTSPNKTFSLRCTSNDTQAVLTDTVDYSTAEIVPSISFETSSSSVTSGSSITLSWSSSNVDSCVASGDWSGNKNVSGSETSAPITSDSTFMISCNGSHGEVSEAAYVMVSPDTTEILLPTVSISSSASNVEYNGESVLSWSSDNADSCSASGDWSGSKPVSGSMTLTGLTSDSSYALTCVGPGGSASDSTAILVANPALPTVSVSAASTDIEYGGSASINWSSTGADSCVATGDWSGNLAVSGSTTIQNLSVDSFFNLSCTGPGGTAADSVVINVADQLVLPAVSLAANTDAIGYNESVTLTWSSTDADYCTATGDWSGNMAASGVTTIDNLTADSNYTLTCFNSAGSDADAVSITVNQVTNGSALLSWTPPTEYTDGSTLTDLAGYKIYYGAAPGDYSEVITVNSVGITSYQIDNLPPGTWYFAMTAFNEDGIESSLSTEVNKTI